MATIKQLKAEIKSDCELSELLNILKGIALAEFQRLQSIYQKKKGHKAYAESSQSFINLIDTNKYRHALLNQETPSQKAILLITSDEGFLGRLNREIIEAGLNILKDHDTLLIIGEKGVNLIKDMNRPHLHLSSLKGDIGFEQIEKFARFLIQKYKDNLWNGLTIVFPKFVSFGIYEIAREVVLPLEEYAKQFNLSRKTSKPLGEVIIESNLEEVLEYIAKSILMQKLFNIFWLSRLSEWSTQVSNLENGRQELNKITDKLRLKYIKQLHALYDKSIREIYASRRHLTQ
ncbi:MAG: F0F1 ATP synthase subunit gamma [bacterium]